jgi:hypothetical protein
MYEIFELVLDDRKPKDDQLRWAKVPSLQRPVTQARSEQAVELTRRDDKRALERLIENLALPVPELSKPRLG